jgi:diacylglycerol kinase (ATP)
LTVIALLIKPEAMRKKAHRKVIGELVNSGALLLSSHTPEEIRAEVSELISQHQSVTVVACGGDGTVHLLLNSVFGLEVTFAVIPMGTGNDFARYLKIVTPQLGLKALNSPAAVPLDVGTIELDSGQIRRFFGIASCGFDAQVNERANRYRGPQGTLKYIAALLGELKNLSTLHLDVDMGGETSRKEVVLLAVGNTSSYGGGMKVCPAADAQDGTFDILWVKPVTRNLLMRVFPRVFRGTHISHPKVEMSKASRVRLSGDVFPIYADGERVGMGPASIHISPQALLVKSL